MHHRSTLDNVRYVNQKLKHLAALPQHPPAGTLPPNSPGPSAQPSQTARLKPQPRTGHATAADAKKRFTGRRRASSIESMLWAVLVSLGLIKLVVASLMLWLPLRTDSAMVATDDRRPGSDSDGDGGSKVPDADPAGPHPGPRRPWPRRPRRGPHGSPSPAAPPRVRRAAPRLPARPWERRRVRATS